MNYKLIHDSIINNAKKRASTKKGAKLILGYFETHHIVPKCMDGDNTKENLVFLSAREHFIVHILLVKIYPHDKSLLYACNRLIGDKRENRTNGKTYESLKRQISEYRKTQNKQNNIKIAEASIKISKSLKGRNKHTHPHVAAQANAVKGRTKFNDAGMAASAAKRRGRTKETCEGVASMAKALTGRNQKNHPGVAKSAESKRKIPLNIQLIIYEKRLAGIKCKDILLWLYEELGYDIHFSGISRIFHKVKNDLPFYTSFATPV